MHAHDITLAHEIDHGRQLRPVHVFAGKRGRAQPDRARLFAVVITFYETILMPAYAAVGLPVSRPAQTTRPATETEPACPAAPAVRGVRLHDLRAPFATMQLMSGVHFMQVSR